MYTNIYNLNIVCVRVKMINLIYAIYLSNIQLIKYKDKV